MALPNSGPEQRGPRADPDELRLAEGLARRDPEIVDEFLRRTHHGVFGMACRLTLDIEQRQDWTHDVLLAILEEMARGNFDYRWPGCFWSWFRKRSHFLLLDLFRRARAEQQRSITGDAADEILDRLQSPSREDAARLLENVEIRATIEACVTRLPSVDHRRAFVLAVLEEASYEQVAQAMDAPLNTVRSWIRRARISVRRCVSLGLDLSLLDGEEA